MERQLLADCLACHRKQLVRPDLPNVNGEFVCVGCGSCLLMIGMPE